jgi:glycosyltransferase involved in cell wall biosynthesis
VGRHKPSAVYVYDGVALETFRAARSQGGICIYDLTHGYWRYDKQLLEEEAQLRPDYAGTIKSYRDTAHFEKKDLELSLADHIIVPSAHVRRTLEHSPAADRIKYIVPYGANDTDSSVRAPGRSHAARLRVLFVGQLTQRKGIGYLFDAIKTMGSAVELTIIGAKTGPSTSLDQVIQEHRWIPSTPNRQILEEMARHDVLVLPSLTEAFGLVIGEALSRGLPVITTTATGGPELIRDGQDGFFVPIRSGEAIAEKLDLLNQDRELLDYMSASALNRAKDFTWHRYRNLLVATLRQVLEQ